MCLEQNVLDEIARGVRFTGEHDRVAQQRGQGATASKSLTLL
jgi:hypothetical protein